MMKNVLGLALVAVAATACSGAEPTSTSATGQPKEETAASAAALSSTLPPGVTTVTYTASVNIGFCRYDIGYGVITTSLPPQNAVIVSKTSVIPILPTLCATRGFQQIGQGYGAPSLSIALGRNNELGASFTSKPTPSGEAHTQATILRLDPTDLHTIVTDGLAIFPFPTGPADIDTANLVFTVPGDLLVVGTKGGTFKDASGNVLELGGVGGANYQATFPGFATATAQSGASQILAW
jgi:hypothetical protein